MKRKNIKLLSFFAMLIFSAIIFSATLLQTNSNTFYQNRENNNLDIKDTSLYALTDGLEAQTTITFKANDEISWANKKYANDVTVGDLEELLILSSPSASIEIVISAITDNDIQNGIVRFEIFQSLRFWTGGIVDPTKTQRVQLMPSANQGSGNIWQTSTGLVLSKKLSFAWASNNIIQSFVNATTSKFSELTKNDVLNNLVDNSSILPTNSNINVNFTDLTNINNSGNLYGVGKIEIIFNGTTDADWVGGAMPNATSRTLIIRGLTNISNNRVSMELLIDPLINISNVALDAAGKIKFASMLLSSNLNPTFGNLFASQFVGIGKTELINVLFSGLYATNIKPIASISYMGISVKDSNFSTLTEIPANLVTQIKVKDIQFSINDLMGSLSIIYKYDSYDVFSNSIIAKESVHSFPPNTFRLNIDSGKNLQFSWKDSNALNIGTSYEVVNNFMNNKTNNEYMLNLSSYFFNAPADVYYQPRTVAMDYVGGGTQEIDQGYISPQNSTQIEIKLVFDTWNGAKYTDATDQSEKYGFSTSAIFDLKIYTYSATELINWTSQTTLLNTKPRLANELPSNISNEVFGSTPDANKYVELNDFLNVANLAITDSQNVVFYPNDINGTIEIRVYIQPRANTVGSGRIYSRFYSGFAKSTSNSAIFQFGWIPQIDVKNQLLNINIYDVTVSDVIEFYLKDIPLFANSTLTDNNVSIEIDSNNTSSLIVSVTMPFFNQDQSNPSNQTFQTVINGFILSLPPTNEANFSAPNNFTLVIAVSGATFIIAILTIVIVVLLFKTISIKKIKQNKKANKKRKNKRDI